MRAVKLLGKLIGSLAGFAVTRHPLGIAAGLALGHAWDRGWFAPWLPGPRRAARDLVVPLFTIAAHLSRADGRVSAAEVTATERLIARLGLDAERRKQAIAAFQRARHGETPLAPAVAALRDYCGYAGAERGLMLEVLLDIAEADGVLAAPTRVVLEDIVAGLGLAPGLLGERLAARRAAGARGPTFDDPYAVLGTHADAADDEVRAAWRRAIGQYHPDRVGTADAATRAALINAAWEQIRRQRGLP